MQEDLVLSPGKVLNTSDDRSWTVVRRLGGGTFGVCYSAFSPVALLGHHYVAIKVPTSEATREEVEYEAELLRRVEDQCQGENPAVKLLQCLEHHNKTLIFMELMDGTLSEIIPDNGLEAAELFPLAKKLLSLVGTLHHAGLAHLDLKEENILVAFHSQASMHVSALRAVTKARRDPSVTDGAAREALKAVELHLRAGGATLRKLPKLSMDDKRLKLGDLGLSSLIDQISRYPGGTLGYKAPECIFGGRCTEKIDLFAVGVMVAQAAAGEELLKVVGKTQHEMEVNVLNQVSDLLGPVSQSVLDTVDDQRVYFARGCLKKRVGECEVLTNLKRWVEINVLEAKSWSQVDVNLLYSLLKRCLALNVHSRGTAASVSRLL